jgi:hypothetical protein
VENCKICVHLCKDGSGYACGECGYWLPTIEEMMDNFCKLGDHFEPRGGVKEKYIQSYEKYKNDLDRINNRIFYNRNNR